MISAIRQPGPVWMRLRILYALVLRDLDYGFRKNRIGALVYTLEPIAFILTMAGTHRYLLNAVPPFGDSIILFYGVGHFPYYFFLRCSSVIGRMHFRSEYPFVNDFDILISRFVIEGLRVLTVMITFMVAIYIYGIESAVPHSPGTCLLAITMLGLFSVGIGMANSGISSYFPFWSLVYPVFSRGVMLVSGVLFVVDRMPPFARRIIAWNPLAHAIEWFKSGIYVGYPHSSLDLSYLCKATALSIIVGGILFTNRAKH